MARRSAGPRRDRRYPEIGERAKRTQTQTQTRRHRRRRSSMANKKKRAAEEEPEPEPEPEEEEPGSDEEEDAGPIDEARAAARKKRRRAVARRKGYRALASKGGYDAGVASADASRDVSANITTLNECIRACKWAPALPNAVSYGTNLSQFRERTKLSHEPLPKGPAAVFRASSEVFARKVMNEAVQRTFDAGKTRVSVNTMASVLRGMQGPLRLDFAAPQGLVRHAQTTIVGPEDKKAPALGVMPLDEAQMKAEAAALPKQVEFAKAEAKKEAERKAKRSSKNKEPDAAPAAVAGRKKRAKA